MNERELLEQIRENLKVKRAQLSEDAPILSTFNDAIALCGEVATVDALIQSIKVHRALELPKEQDKDVYGTKQLAYLDILGEIK